MPGHADYSLTYRKNYTPEQNRRFEEGRKAFHAAVNTSMDELIKERERKEFWENFRASIPQYIAGSIAIGLGAAYLGLGAYALTLDKVSMKKLNQSFSKPPAVKQSQEACVEGLGNETMNKVFNEAFHLDKAFPKKCLKQSKPQL